MTIITQAERILADQPQSHLADAHDDVAKAMRDNWHLTVEPSAALSQRGHGGWCDGMSITRAGIVLYRATGNRRQHFTLAHELAHYLVEYDEDCYNWLADRPDAERELEQICDVIASRILIPAALLDSVLAGGAPTAATVADLYARSAASWSACAVAIAGRLPCDGFVAIIDDSDGSIFFSARARDTHPYAWHGDIVPEGHHLRGDVVSERATSWWPRFNVNERRPYYLSTQRFDGYTNAIFAENDLWSIDKLHIYSDQEDRRHDGRIDDCPSCGYTGRTALFPCSKCHAPTCQRCQKCDCDRDELVQRLACRECTVSVRSHLLKDGLCPDCR